MHQLEKTIITYLFEPRRREVGPPLQNNTWNVLMRNRMWQVVLTGDMKQIVLKIRIQEPDKDPDSKYSNPVKIYIAL